MSTYSYEDAHIERAQQNLLQNQDKKKALVISRRTLLCGGVLAGVAGAFMCATPRIARGDVSASLATAEEELAAAEAQLDAMAAEFEALAIKNSETLTAIDELNVQIEQTEANIEEKAEELAESQELLAERVSTVYKNGNVDLLSILLESSSFSELTSNLYYFSKISQADAELIEEVRTVKEELEAQQAQLEAEKDELEQLSADEQAQLEEMRENQETVSELISSLSTEVQELLAQRDAELAAAAAAAAAAQQTSSSSSSGSSSGSSSVTISGEGALSAVVSACYSTPSPGAGWCAAWVTNVFSNAGLGYYGGNANDMYSSWCTSSDRSALTAGMIIAVSTHSHTTSGIIYGHVGIYIGGGVVMDNVGYIRSIAVDEWINYYQTTVTARWGWLGGVVLS